MAVEFDDMWPFPTAATDPAAGLSLRDGRGSTRKVKGSHVTQRWRKPDSNSWSRFEKSRPYKTRYTESEWFGRRERHHSGGNQTLESASFGLSASIVERAEDHLPEGPRHRVCRAFFP
jgi:hypothetical protein